MDAIIKWTAQLHLLSSQKLFVTSVFERCLRPLIQQTWLSEGDCLAEKGKKQKTKTKVPLSFVVSQK